MLAQNDSRARGCTDVTLSSATDPLKAAVIPAKAGIYSVNLRESAVDGLDSSRHGGTGMTGVSKGIPSQMTPTLGQAIWGLWPRQTKKWWKAT
jgi:hypothetical protein